MTILLVLFVASGLLMTGLSLPLLRGKVAPNSWYGFRVPATLNDPVVWYAVNAYAAKGFLCVGLTTVVAAIALYFVPELSIALYGTLVAAVVLSGLVVCLALSFRYMNNITKHRGEPGA